MKRIISVLVLTILIVGLMGCGNKDNISNDNNGNVNKEVNIDDILANKKNFYVMINGRKLNVGDKISDVLKIGYQIQDSDLNETIPSHRYLIGKRVKGREDTELFLVIPLNLSNSTVIVKDAVIGGFEVGDYNYDELSNELLNAKIEVYGGIKIGSSYDDMVKVFGKDYYEYDSNPDGLSDKVTYKSYDYRSGYKSFEFVISENGKISKIKWKNYDYNE